MFRRFADLSNVHFVGIGGAGMSGIAEVLSDYDLTVTGCDLHESEATARLRSLGVKVEIGHSPAHLESVDLVVVSSAVDETNVEVRGARERGLTIVRRAEMLAELMRLKYGIAVAGTHGKTTTTSLIGTLLTEAGLDPTVIVGGRLRVTGTGARLGRSEYLVAEADEFDRSFLRLQPILAVVTSIDTDHLDTYRDLDDICDAFVRFASKVPFFGELIVCLDDPNVRGVLPRLSDRRTLTYGFSPHAELSARDLEVIDGGSRFSVHSAAEGPLGSIEIPLPGRHNAQNALAAVAVGRAVGLNFDQIASALEKFSGVHRRFERLGSWHGAEVVDDYAHHPTEVAATLEAARVTFPGRRLHVVFQPHLFSRTREQAEAFGQALLAAEHAIVTEIYPSREAPIEGVTSLLVSDAARRSGHQRVDDSMGFVEARAQLDTAVEPGDVIITMGAGDIYRLGAELAAEGAQEQAEESA
ncbi:MAG: UDP-N-acetylmuramate--L-alanine ligase [bacterium]|nr:UDP-N-acetylmuramate--L-alanine ligase [bacterium]